MNTAAIVLGLAAMGGATLAGIRLSGKPRPPTWLAVVHGVVAATGLVLLAYEVFTYSVPMATQISLGILVLAALGGLVLFLGFHLKERELPLGFVVGHGFTAIAGYVTLLFKHGECYLTHQHYDGAWEEDTGRLSVRSRSVSFHPR